MQAVDLVREVQIPLLRWSFTFTARSTWRVANLDVGWNVMVMKVIF